MMSRSCALGALAFVLTGCPSFAKVISISGRVLDEPFDDADPIDGATVEILDEAGDPYATTTADSDGAFAVDAPAGSRFTLIASADGARPTAFGGSSGVTDLRTTDGQIWAASDARIDELKAQFSNCPSVDDEGAIITGEVHLYVSGVGGDSLPLVTTATVTVEPSVGDALSTCYLDDDGVSSADAVVTGATGTFAAFGAPPGPLLLSASYTLGDASSDPRVQDIVVPEDGFVPLYPLYVDQVN